MKPPIQPARVMATNPILLACVVLATASAVDNVSTNIHNRPEIGATRAHKGANLGFRPQFSEPLVPAVAISAPSPESWQLPEPVAFWTFQESTGANRTSNTTVAREGYVLTDGDPTRPVPQSTAGHGIFGPFSANFTAESPSQRLTAPRAKAAALTTGLSGPNTTLTMIAWVKRDNGVFKHDTRNPDWTYGFVAGVWGDTPPLLSRQYALYLDLGACKMDAPSYSHGAAAHVSNCGGATPGHPFCVTAACDPRSLEVSDWHCLANVYDGANITSLVNGTLVRNGKTNPFPYPGGVFDPEANNRTGADFDVGVSPSYGINQYTGLLGGLVVYDTALSVDQVRQVCQWPSVGGP